MSTKEKLKARLLDGKKLKFVELQHLLIVYGFELLRVKGDHFIYARQDIGARASIQPEFSLKEMGMQSRTNEWLEDSKKMGWKIPKPSQPEAVAI